MKKKKNIFIVVVIAIILVQFVYAKYVMSKTEIRAVESTAFYFNSNLLQSTLSESYKLLKIEKSSYYDVVFNVNNYENNYLINNEDIEFTLSSETDNDNITAQILDNTIPIDSKYTETLRGKEKTQKEYILRIHTGENVETNTKYHVTLRIDSISPYVKEHEIKFEIQIVNDFSYEVIDYDSEIVKLKLQIYDNVNDIRVDFDNTKLMLIRDRALMPSVDNDTNFFIIEQSKLKSNKTYEIVFLKKDGGSTQISVSG